VQWTLTFSASDFTAVQVSDGPAATAAGKSTICAAAAGSITCLAVGLSSSSIANGVVATATFTLSPASTAAPLPIQLLNTVAASPGGVGIPTSASSGTVTTIRLASAALAGLSCNAASLLTPATTSCVVSLTVAAPAGGVTVLLATSDPSLSVPQSVTVPAGSLSAGLTATAAAVAITTNAVLTASLNGVSLNYPLTLSAPAAVLSLSCNPATVTGGSSSICTVGLTQPASGDGVSVALSSSSPAVTVPSSVAAPPGATGASFKASAAVVALTTTATISAGTRGGTVATTLTVNPAPSIVPAAVFAKTDASTQGAWKGVYGSAGYSIAGDSTAYSSWAQVNMSGQSLLWAESTTDPRALQKAASLTNRVAGAWYSPGSLTIDLNLADGNPHQVALYCLDWDAAGRSQTIDILDASGGAVLDSRGVSAFGSGLYLAWNLKGHVQIRVTRTAGPSAVVSGLFLDAASVPAASPVPDFWLSAAPASQGATRSSRVSYSVTLSAAGGFAQTVDFRSSGLPPGASAAFSPASLAASGSSVLTITTGPDEAAGRYTITITGAGGGLTRATTVTLIVTAPITAAATFVKADKTTKGAWKGTYGLDGHSIAGDASRYPGYARVSFAGASTGIWAGSTTDARALQKAASSPADRIAAAWYAPASFTIELHLTDGNPHPVALYCLDWEGDARPETIDILDAVSGQVLHSRNASSIAGGLYVVWNLTGHVKIRVTRKQGTGPLVSGLFFR